MKTLDIGVMVERFLDAISGEMFFATGDMEEDYNLIMSQIKANGGYWAGLSTRYYFDKELNLLRTEERTFG